MTNMSQFPIEQSSVIKTAPPGRQHDEFSPKTEPLELAPLTHSNLQDLSKMQPIDSTYYHVPAYTRVYNDYASSGLGITQNTLLSHPNVYYGGVFNTVAQQDWGRQMDYNTQQYNRQTALQYSQENPQERYKVDIPSPVDSGIGADLSLINAKEEFFQSDSLLDRSAERALSHRDSPVVIPKLHNTCGFQYTLEAPISTSIRKEDDRMTYVNKGQFYTVSMEYLQDVMNPLKSQTVKSQIIVVFREDKTYEEEIKAWQAWHFKQHSIKQRILEVDSKNSSGMIGQIEEIGHNAVQFYWNPQDQVKISIAVQCLSTDFSVQKGVKGLALHVQIDSYDGENEKIPFHRGYCQIKVFCDKGAERKLRDEDKRAQKRKLAGNHSAVYGALSGRKKSDGEYHEPCEQSPFYHMRDVEKPAALFVAPEEYEGRFTDGGVTGGVDVLEMEPLLKRPRLSDRLMLYIRKRGETVYNPLHVVPPDMPGLARALALKYQVDPEKIINIYKRCPAKNAVVKIDDEMLRHYCNEDTFELDFEQSAEDPTGYAIFLMEVVTSQPSYTSQP